MCHKCENLKATIHSKLGNMTQVEEVALISALGNGVPAEKVIAGLLDARDKKVVGSATNPLPPHIDAMMMGTTADLLEQAEKNGVTKEAIEAALGRTMSPTEAFGAFSAAIKGGSIEQIVANLKAGKYPAEGVDSKQPAEQPEAGTRTSVATFDTTNGMPSPADIVNTLRAAGVPEEAFSLEDAQQILDELGAVSHEEPEDDDDGAEVFTFDLNGVPTEFVLASELEEAVGMVTTAAETMDRATQHINKLTQRATRLGEFRNAAGSMFNKLAFATAAGDKRSAIVMEAAKPLFDKFPDLFKRPGQD